MLTEELAALARFHQFDETQLDGTMLDPVQKGVELVDDSHHASARY